MIYLFDKDEKLIKIVRKSAVKTALQKYALTTERYVSDRLTVELKGLNADELEQVEYMAIQTMEDAHTFHYFYVAQKFSDSLTTLIGVQSGIEELRKSPVYDKRPKNAFARDVITDLLAGTNWQVRFVGETTPHSTNFYYTSVFDALKKVCEVWDLEMQFFVEMNGNRIGGRYIDFKRRIGEAVGKRVVYGHNALQILQEVERTNIFTALVGRGKGEETGDGYGRKITFENVVWSTTQGKPVNKPKGQKYLELPLMTRQYGIKNADGSMRPKIGFVDFSEEENAEILIERTYKALIDAARPQLTLKTSSVYLKGVKVGDTIRVVRHDKKLDYDTRIFEITFNRLNNQSSDIKLGDRIGESNEVKAQTIAEKAVEQFVTNEFSNFVQNLPDYLPSADGFNNNWYGAEDPTVKYPGKVLINDIWYKPDPEHEGHKIMLRWTGEVWEEILRTYESEALRDRITEEIAQVNQSMQAQAQEHDRQVADILSKTQSVESLANQAKSDASNALASATQLKADAVNEAQRLVNTLKTETVASSNQLKQQIDTVGNQLSSQQAELLQATQTVRGLDAQVKSVANQLGTQQTTITQLVNDGNARGQKIADFETSLDGVTTKLQNLWNGSRNLLSNTELLTGYDGVLPYPKNHYLNKAVFRWTHKATDTAFKEGLVMQVNDTLVNPKEMILSFYAHASTQTTVRCYMHNPNGRKAVETSTGYTATNVDGYAEVTIGTSWRRYWVRYTYQVGYVAKPYVIIGRSPDTVTADSTVSIVAPALYHGHYNRDWQPSDVDITSDFATYKQTIDQNLAQLGSDIRTANGSVTSLRTEYNQTKSEIALLASKSDFDALTQKTQSLEASLKVQAGKIDLKAERTLIDTINQQISSAQAELTVVNDAIAQRVTKTDFNAVKRTAEANATAIMQVNNAIELKAEKTYVEGVKSTADSALAKANANANTITQTKAELKVASDAIETKATKTDLNNLTGRMTNAETNIRTQAGQIEQRLTSTQVNELVDGKGYATSSSVQNIVKETADSFSRTISAVETKIPTEAGGTNLVRGSADLKQGANGWREGHWRNSGSGGTVEYNVALPSSPVNGIVKGVKIVNSDNNQIGLCQDKIALEPGTYTMSVWVIGRRGLKVHISGAYSQDTSNPFASGNTFVTLGRYGWTLISQTFTLDKRYENLTLGYMMLDSAGTVYFAAPYIHKSSMSGDWSPAVEDLATVTALHEVKDTVSSHTRTISDQGQAISQVVQTANGLVQEVSGANGLKNQVSQLKNSWAVKLSGPDGLKTAINASTDGIRLLGKNIRLDGNTLIDNGIIKSAMIGNGQIGTAHIGTIDASVANIINLNANKITGLDANFIKSKIELAIIDWMKGKTIVAQNGNMNIDLNNSGINMFKDGVIRFYSGSNAIYRQTSDGIHTGFVHFDTTSKGGIYASLGSTSSRDGINSKSSGRFAGIRVARTSERLDSHIASQDAVELYGDTIFFGHGFEGGGFSMHTTLTGGKTISLNKIHDAIINLCRCWIHLRNVDFNPNDAAFKKALDVELGQAQQLYNEIARIT